MSSPQPTYFFDPILHSLHKALVNLLGKAGAKWMMVLISFAVHQIWACLFGVLIILGIILSASFYPENVILSRYDFLVVYAIGIQGVLIWLKMESWDEVKVITLFHIVGTAMEIYKTYHGSWIYPEENFLRVGGVPLFTGFMYASVGSYLARISRGFQVQYTSYPPMWMTVILAILVYINFFLTNHQIDYRWWLFGLTALLYFRCFTHVTIWDMRFKVPLLLGFIGVAFLIYVAENIGTYTTTWLYPNQQDGWKLVQIAKMGSWFLLMIISFVLVTFVHHPTAPINPVMYFKKPLFER